MAWTLGGERIYVEEDTGWVLTPRYGEIDILDSTQTILHYAGLPSKKRTITFVVFSGYHDNIIPLLDGTSKALVSDQGSEGNVYIKDVSAERLRDISRTTEVHRVTMELMKDDS